jgi:hypothetical protein
MRNQIKSLRLVSAVAGASLFCCSASAATLSLSKVTWQENPDGKLVSIVIQQEIDPTDPDRLYKEYRKAKRKGLTVIALEMDSWGGNGGASMAIAEFVRERKLFVYVPGNCKSGCTFAALAALAQGRLVVGPWGYLGVHQAYWGKLDAAVPDIGWTEWCADQMTRWGVPSEVTDAMVAQRPGGFTWFDADQLEAMGARKVGKWFW